MSEMSRIFARYALTRTEFSGASMRAAKTFMLDSFGVGIAGSRAPFSDAVFETVQKWGGAVPGGNSASIWGRGLKAPAASAAFMNGFQIHSMEYDCVHEPAVVHPMATILAALSAEAESRNDISGKDLIEAVIIAVDIAIEIGVAAETSLKFFRPATAGLFGATLGVARLRGFDEETALSAMGCALAQCAGVMQAHIEGKPTLPAQIAGAARAAIVACDLAQAGLAGPESSLEGTYGYFALFEDKSDVAAAAARLGNVSRITEVSWKPFPTGRAGQGGIVCIQNLRAQGVQLDNFESLTLSAPPIILKLVDRPASAKMTPNYARLCFPYLAAITLLRGTVSLNDFGPDSLSNPDLLRAAGKVNLAINAVTDPAEFTPQTATAVMTNGSTLKASIDTLFGSPSFPLTDAQHLDKFRACIEFGLRDVNAKKAALGLIVAVDMLETASDCRDIMKLACADAGGEE